MTEDSNTKPALTTRTQSVTIGNFPHQPAETYCMMIGCRNKMPVSSGCLCASCRKLMDEEQSKEPVKLDPFQNKRCEHGYINSCTVCR